MKIEGKVAEDEPTRETQQEVKIGEDDETNIYSKLQGPSEDLYSHTVGGASQKKGTSRPSNIRLWKGVCACLAGLCLLLLIVIFVLVKPEAKQGPPTPASLTPWIRPGQHASLKQGSGCPQCADGWLNCGQSCFFLSGVRMTWDEGQKHCLGKGGNLAIVTNQTVQNFLTKNGGLTYWIGLRLKGSWAWVDDTPLAGSYWSNLTAGGNCAVLKGSRPNNNWSKSSCEREYYFICETKI